MVSTPLPCSADSRTNSCSYIGSIKSTNIFGLLVTNIFVLQRPGEPHTHHPRQPVPVRGRLPAGDGLEPRHAVPPQPHVRHRPRRRARTPRPNQTRGPGRDRGGRLRLRGWLADVLAGAGAGRHGGLLQDPAAGARVTLPQVPDVRSRGNWYIIFITYNFFFSDICLLEIPMKFRESFHNIRRS